MEITLRNGTQVYLDGKNMAEIGTQAIVNSPIVLLPNTPPIQVQVDKLLSLMQKNQLLHGRLFFEVISPSEIEKLEIKDTNYSWYGMRFNAGKLISYDTKSIHLDLLNQDSLSEDDANFLKAKWEKDYFGADFMKNKTQEVLSGMEGSYESVLGSKIHWLVKKQGKILAHLSIKTFFFPWTNNDSGALHIWVSNEIPNEERAGIHKLLSTKALSQIDFPLFAGVSVENTKAIQSMLKYGFDIFQLDIKDYN